MQRRLWQRVDDVIQIVRFVWAVQHELTPPSKLNRVPIYTKSGELSWYECTLTYLRVPHLPNRALYSPTAGSLVIPSVSKSRMGGRAFSYHTLLLHNHEGDTLPTFKIRLKTFLFDKALSYGKLE